MSDRKTRTELSYYVRDNNSGDDIINININWEQGDASVLKENLNRWLKAINAPLSVDYYPTVDVSEVFAGHTGCGNGCGGCDS